MLMSYSSILFLMGLTTYVITPLYDGRAFDVESRVSLTFLFFKGSFVNQTLIPATTRLQYSTLCSSRLEEVYLYGVHFGHTDS